MSTQKKTISQRALYAMGGNTVIIWNRFGAAYNNRSENAETIAEISVWLRDTDLCGKWKNRLYFILKHCCKLCGEELKCT
jgi:hypothetical protein